MGVKGLLPCLQSITRNISLEKYRGLTAAVDAMCWLHKGVFTGDVRALAKYQQQQQQQQLLLQQQNEPMADKSLSSKDGPEFNDDSQSHGIHDNASCSRDVAKRLDFDQFATGVKKPRHNRTASIAHHHNNIIQPLAASSCLAINNTDAQMAMMKCADYVIRHTEEVRQKYGIEIILVIDGGSLPSKKNVDEKRRLERQDAFRKGLQADKRGDSREARKQFTRACSISHEIRHEMIIQCKLKGIPFVVAPYESDAQLAKLAHDGVVDVVISEDSDLLAYGCPRVLFKIDFRSGRGDEIQVMRDLASNSSPSFRHWNHDMFVYMCILAGCDYCEGIPGIGIQTAHKIVRMHRKPSKIFKILGSTGKLPQGFEEMFWTAYNTFRHQRIYCLEKGVIEPLFPIEQDSSNDSKGRWQFLGAWLEPSIGRGIADGSLHPVYHIPWTQINGQCKQNKIHSSSSCANDEFQKGRTRKNRSDQRMQGVVTSSSSSRRSSLFAFFKNDKTIVSSHDTIKPNGQQRRLPLQEITFNHHESDDLFHNNRSSNNTFDGGHSMVPTHFYDYSSKLVSMSFQPLSRNTSTQRYFQKRKGASKAIKKLKNRLSLKRVQEIENARRSAQQQHKDCTEQEMFENIQQCYSSTSNNDISDGRNHVRKEMAKVEHNVDEFNNALGLVETMTSNSEFLLPTEDEFSRYNFPDFDYFADPSLPLYDCLSTTKDHDILQRGKPQVHEEHNVAPKFLGEDMSIYCSDDPVVTHRFEQQNSFSTNNNCRFQDFGEMQFLLQNVQMTDNADGGHTNNEGSTSSKMMEKQQATMFEDGLSHFDYETFHDENQSRTDPDKPSHYYPTNERDPIQNDYEAFVGLHPF